MTVQAVFSPDAVRLWRAVCENATAAMFIMDEKQHCAYMNPAAEQLTGFTFAEVQGRPLHDVIHHTRPDGSPFPLEECAIDRAFPENMQEQGEEVFVHKDGSFYPVAFTASPLARDDAEVVGTIVEVRDLREAKKAEQLKLEDTRLIEATFENVAVGIAHVGVDGDWLKVNRRLCEIVGYARDELMDMTFQDITHKDDLHADLDQFEKLMRGEIDSYAMEKRYIRKDGETIWISLTTSLQRDANQHPMYCISVVEDITERKADASHLEVMAKELNHRVKNTLQVVQAMASQTLSKSSSLETAKESFVGRLHALSAVHDLLLKESWAGSKVSDVVTEALKPFGYAPGAHSQIQLDGPPARLNTRQAQTLSMTVHELATNATKYGALSVEGGVVQVAWTCEPATNAFSFTWTERHGPPATPPTRDGFGTMMLTRIFPREIDGTAETNYDTAGFSYQATGALA